MSYLYLASPYTHNDPAVMEERYQKAAEMCAYLLRRGMYVYSPIVHCHELAKNFDLPRDFSFWKGYNTAMLRHADKLLVLTIPGVSESVGVQEEISLAASLNLPTIYFSRPVDLLGRVIL
jgi:hypothetical protein